MIGLELPRNTVKPTAIGVALLLACASCTELKAGWDGGTGDGGRSSTGNGDTGEAGASIDRSGDFVGVTSQQRLFEMHVLADAVFDVRFDWDMRGSTPYPNTDCSAKSSVDTIFGAPAEISTTGHFERGPVGSSTVTFDISGVLSSDGEARGSINASYNNTNPGDECSGSGSFTWQAIRVACGNGTLEWPETCDDGDQDSDEICTETCQLFPVKEIEPNDSVADTTPPFATDTLISGSLESAGDADVFAIRNPYPGPVAISLETHGETPGVCWTPTRSVDTVIDVLNAAGTVLATDDDGSRAFSCSRLSISVAGSGTVYARVRSGKGPIPAYLLHIRFQSS